MRILIFFLAIVFTGLTFSCKNKQQETKLIQIDSLQKIADQLLLKIQQTDTTKYSTEYKHIKLCNSIFKEYAVEVPTENNFRNRFVEFTQLEKNFKRFFKGFAKLIMDLKFTVNQLDNLKADVKNNAIPEEKINKYYTQELDAINACSAELETLLANAEMATASYHILIGEMEAYSEKLKNTVAKK